VRKNQSKEPSPEKKSKRSKPSQRKAKAFTCGPLGALELAKREQRKVYDTLKEQGFILNVNSFLPEEHITWMHGHFPNPHPDELLYAVRAGLSARANVPSKMRFCESLFGAGPPSRSDSHAL
jgi:hypothetical protein